METIVFASSTVSPVQQILLPAATVAMGIAAAWLTAYFVSLFTRPLPQEADSWEFENARRIRLRAGCQTYRFFEPFIDELKKLPLLHRLGRKDRVTRNLAAGADPMPWEADEFLAARFIEGLIAAVAVAVIGFQWLSVKVALGLALLAPVLFIGYGARKLNRKAETRIREVKRRLPFGIDLISLMMEAGAGLRESLGSVARENHGHPLGEEFGKVIYGLDRGQTLRESLTELQRRLNDQDINDMVYAILKAEELGTPLSKIFLTMADQMRLRRSQWAEKAAGEAQANITFPGLVIMVACMLIVVAPFVLSAVMVWPF